MAAGAETGAEVMTPGQYYGSALEKADGDLSRAVQSIGSPEDALNFAMGLADESGYGDNHSAGFANAVIINAVAELAGPGTPNYNPERYRAYLDFWARPLNMMKTAQNTPGMLSALREGRDFEPVARRDDIPYSRERFISAFALFSSAGKRLAANRSNGTRRFRYSETLL